MLNENSVELKIERLKSAKSAYVLEADASLARGLDSAGMALFCKAAELELDLAGLFGTQGNVRNAQVSLRSAGFCYVRARQYRQARVVLNQVAEQFTDVRDWLASNEQDQDFPLTSATPGLQALIDLLVTKGIIQESEWAAALSPH